MWEVVRIGLKLPASENIVANISLAKKWQLFFNYINNYDI